MEMLMMYLLKMLVCSGMLFGYYRLALYNERFHQWNRFYLLAALLVSVVVPFIRIPIFAEEEASTMVVIIASLPWNSTVAGVPKPTGLSWQDGLLLTLALISFVLLAKVMVNIARLVITYKANPVSSLDKKVKLIVTQLSTAPFSFFNWLFWRKDIDPESDNGQRMLTHELTHIREHHSADKIFTEVLLCIFWVNPFFWLIRRELATIHEFLADRRAIEQQDGAAFAAMMLQALHVQPAAANGLVNPFFSSQIKRRLLMITTSKEPRYSYLRRLSGLVLMIFSAAVLTLTMQQVQAQQKQKTPPKKTTSPKGDSLVITRVQIAKNKLLNNTGDVITLEADSILWNKNKDEVIAITGSGEKVKIEIGPDNKGRIIIDKSSITNGKNTNILSLKTGQHHPLYIWDGKEMDEKEFQGKDGNEISAINVLKGEQATAAYGERGKYGVILITSKSSTDLNGLKGKVTGLQVEGYNGSGTKHEGTGSLKEVMVTGYGSKNTDAAIFIDGKEVTREHLDNLDPGSIESMNVLKGENATQKYGAKGKEGVIEIITKQAVVHDKVFTRVEQPAQFPGGEEAWQRYLETNLKYPEAAQKAGTEGVARIQFIVDEQGAISNIKIVNDPGNGIGQEAAQLIRKGPKWKPAVQNGREVVYQVQLPITFKLNKYF